MDLTVGYYAIVQAVYCAKTDFPWQKLPGSDQTLCVHVCSIFVLIVGVCVAMEFK